MARDMTKTKALMDLAKHAVAKQRGVSLAFIMDQYGVTRRTAQRWTEDLEQEFPDVDVLYDERGRKSWRLPPETTISKLSLNADDLAVLDLAEAALANVAPAGLLDQFKGLKQKIHASIPRKSFTRIDADLEALLISQKVAVRPGPKERVDEALLLTLAYAFKAGAMIQFDYVPRAGAAKTHTVAPYGLIFGHRKYLIAKHAEHGHLTRFRLSAMSNTLATKDMFEVEDDFDLGAYAEQSFGAFHTDEEYDDVVLEFSGMAADRAQEFQFHPRQSVERKGDKTLVRFTASGWVELAWHLHMWGEHVKVLAPDGLIQEIETPNPYALP